MADSDPVAFELATLMQLRRCVRQAELDDAGASVKSIHRCLPEATLFFNGLGRAMTAWRWKMPDNRIEIRYESGWGANPSEFAFPNEEGAVLVSGDDLEVLTPAGTEVLDPSVFSTENLDT